LHLLTLSAAQATNPHGRAGGMNMCA